MDNELPSNAPPYGGSRGVEMTEAHLQLDVLDRILTKNLGWIAAADSKIPSLLAVSTGMLGVLAALAPGGSRWGAMHSVLSAVPALLLLAAVICLGFAQIPRVRGPKGSMVYFDGIVGLEREAYVDAVLCGITKELLKDFARQCHRNAEIAQSKFRLVRAATLLVLSAIVPWLVAVSLLYVASHGSPSK